MKLFSAYYNSHDPFGIFDHTIPVLNAEDIDNDGCLILWGGEDISPSIYNQEPVHARAGRKPSMRDMVEIGLAQAAIKKGVPIIGICRGAQLMCALSGGTLFQHIEGTKHSHHDNHLITTYDGHKLKTSSCHHQALNISGTDGHVLAQDDVPVVAYTDKEQYQTKIPEVVFFKSTKTLAIQGHPEWMSERSEFVQWCANQIKDKLWQSPTV